MCQYGLERHDTTTNEIANRFLCQKSLRIDMRSSHYWGCNLDRELQLPIGQVIAKPERVQVLARVGDKSMAISFWRRCIRIASMIGGADYIHVRLRGAFVMIQRRRTACHNRQKKLSLIAWFILWCWRLLGWESLIILKSVSLGLSNIEG